MPRPPDIPDLAKVNFITAYMFQLCVPDFYAMVEFAKKPAGKLAMIVIGLDAEDMVKEWLRPGRGRQRKPARHGRKWPRIKFSWDLNDMVATQPRAMADSYPGIQLPGTRALFYLGDQFDRVAITAAVVEGVTDVGFQSLLGVIQSNPNNCPTLPYINRFAEFPVTIVGIEPWDTPVEADTLEGANLFTIGTPFRYRCDVSDWYLGWSAKVVALSAGGTNDWRPGIWSNERGLIAQGSAANLSQGGEQWVEVGADLAKGESAWPCRTNVSGTVELHGVRVFGFGGGLW